MVVEGGCYPKQLTARWYYIQNIWIMFLHMAATVSEHQLSKLIQMCHLKRIKKRPLKCISPFVFNTHCSCTAKRINSRNMYYKYQSALYISQYFSRPFQKISFVVHKWRQTIFTHHYTYQYSTLVKYQTFLCWSSYVHYVSNLKH